MPSRSVRAGGRRHLVLVLLAATALALAACSSSSAPPTADPVSQGTAAATEFLTILQQPAAAKADRLKAFLAPEFQLVRDSGDHLGKDAYIANPATVATFTISDVTAAQGGDVLTVSYRLSTQETINGVTRTTTAPRLSVFRWIDGSWRLAAHSNFAALGN